jgi:hypothetical protein
LTSPNPLSTLQKQFACARLSRSCLQGSSPQLSATLTTMDFGHSRSRWLGIGYQMVVPEGQYSLRSAVWTGDARDTRPGADLLPWRWQG